MNQVKTIALLALLGALLVNICYWLIGGLTGAIIGLGLAAISNGLIWYCSDKWAIAAYGALSLTMEQSLRIEPMVRRLCNCAHLPMPKLYRLPTPVANAFATGRDPEHAAIAVTEGLLDKLPNDELAGVIAHELSHIKNRDTLTQTVAATLTGAITFLIRRLSSGSGGWPRSSYRRRINPFIALVMIVLAPMTATILKLALSRSRELAADAGAAELTGNPPALAKALQRIQSGDASLDVEPAFTPLLIIGNWRGANWSSGLRSHSWWARLFLTHPPTEIRVERLLNMDIATGSPPSD